MDVTRIAPKLWQGSKPAGSLRGFDAIVLCAEEHQPEIGGIEVIRCPLHDAALSGPEALIAVQCAKRVASLVLSGKRVLVTCQQGRNRSGLVTALVLHLLTGQSGRACVSHVKTQRDPALRAIGLGPALANRTFVDFLSRVRATRPEVRPCA